MTIGERRRASSATFFGCGGASVTEAAARSSATVQAWSSSDQNVLGAACLKEEERRGIFSKNPLGFAAIASKSKTNPFSYNLII